MTKINFYAKIKLTIGWVGFFSLLYFLVAVWLESDGVHFNRKLTYQLLKDTLTLTAAFFAPIAALVLFSDWREQHKAIKKDTHYDEVLKDVIKVKHKLNGAKNQAISRFTLGLELDTEEHYVGKLLDIHKSIEKFGLNLEFGNNEDKEFVGFVKDFKKAADDMIMKLLQCHTSNGSNLDVVLKAFDVVEVYFLLIVEFRPDI